MFPGDLGLADIFRPPANPVMAGLLGGQAFFFTGVKEFSTV
jgi:hypothetical protein